MAQQVVAADSQPCVWMCAGLVRYRLCDRDFDCESCPLDAALRGEHAANWHGTALLNRRAGQGALPDDRFYSTGHTWAQRLLNEDSVWRVGLDAFAAALIGSAVDIAWATSRLRHESHEPICEIDVGLGVLVLGAPISGRFLRLNEALREQPTQLLTDPYESGWIADFTVTDDAAVADLLTPLKAGQQLALDLRRFRRTVAFRLFADVASKDVYVPDAESISDLRNLIGGAQYVDCIREFIY